MRYNLLSEIFLPSNADFSNIEKLKYMPLFYFKKGQLQSPSNPKEYNLYVSLLLPVSCSIDPSPDHITIDTVGATSTITIKLVGNNTSTQNKIVYFQLENVGRPDGFKIATMILIVKPPLGAIENPEGSRTNSADYGDADENP